MGSTLPIRSPSTHGKVAKPSSPNSATNDSRHADSMGLEKKSTTQQKVLQYVPNDVSVTGSHPSLLVVGQQEVTDVLPVRSPSPHGKVAQPSSPNLGLVRLFLIHMD
jgi:hypothetical protein